MKAVLLLLAATLLPVLVAAVGLPLFLASRDDFGALQTQAERGNAAAQYSIGWRYDDGEGVPVDDAEAVKWYRLAAEQGYPAAEYSLGVMYANGEGVLANDVEAVKWYRIAAGHGDAKAQYSIGWRYLNGRGVPQDDAEAATWYLKAGEQGIAMAQLALGMMYDIGRGVPQNDAEAVRWYRLAGEQGSAAAQHNLGIMYRQGRGVPQDYVEAHMWLNLAASRESGPKAKSFAEDRNTIAVRMTPQQISEAQRLARDWNAKPWDELRGQLDVWNSCCTPTAGSKPSEPNDQATAARLHDAVDLTLR